MNQVFKSHIFIATIVILFPLVAAAEGLSLPNYLSCGSFAACITKLIDAVIPLIMALAAFFIVLSGYKFLTAQGDPGKIKDAQNAFMQTVIGVAIVVGAQLIIRVLMDILGAL